MGSIKGYKGKAILDKAIFIACIARIRTASLVVFPVVWFSFEIEKKTSRCWKLSLLSFVSSRNVSFQK